MKNHQDNQVHQTETKVSCKTCPCGHDKNHPMSIGHNEYSGIGMFLHLVGISAKPVKIRYQCLVCDKYFDETTDPNILRRVV